MISMTDKLNLVEKRVDELTRALQVLNSSTYSIEGVTSGTPNTQLEFVHKLGRKPTVFYPVYGDVYLFDSNAASVDIRSTQTSVKFKIILN